jgi:LEA14-like dessication related protein
MSLSKNQKIFIFGGLGLALASIFAYLKINIDKIYNAKWEFDGIKNLIINKDFIKFTIFLKLNNKGSISLYISEQDYDVYINEVYVSKIKNNESIKIVSNGITRIPFNIKLYNKNLLDVGIKNIPNLIINQDKINITLKGYLTIKAGIINLKKYNFEEKFNLKEILSNKDKDEEKDK